MSNKNLGTLLIVSGPSGSGKTTLCRRAEAEGLATYSISCTTRTPRAGEIDGKDYYFLTQKVFDARASSGDFLEHACVHGHCYGTLRSEVTRHLEQGKNVVMDIDVQGAASIRACPDPIIRRAYADVYIYLARTEVEARLRGRSTDSEEIIQLRLHNASLEDARRSEYQFILPSASREHDYTLFKALLSALSLRSSLRNDEGQLHHIGA